MKKIIVLIAATLSFSANAQTSIGIASGPASGTNWPMVEDIRTTCSTPQHPINNIKSEGSLDNIFKVASDKNVQFSVAQIDAMVYQQGLDPKMMEREVMVFPFFTVEMHLVVRADSKIQSFADLQGKRVVEGPEGSGTWVSVQVIKATTGVGWAGYKMSQTEGLKAVQDGLVDAEFVVAGMPITMLNTASGIRLIPISHPKLDAFKYYNKTMIPSGTYPFQKTSIPTYKVDNVLVTYAFKTQYQKEIGELVTCITRNLDTLQTSGHPKWRSVDPLAIDSIKWQSHPAAVKAIKSARSK